VKTKLDKNNKVVLVTGGGTGIGKAISSKFAKLGYSVIISYNKSSEDATETFNFCESYSSNNYLVQADLSKEDDIESLFKDISKRYKFINVLVNCAGWTTFISHEDIENLTEEIFDKVIDVNLKAPFFCTRYALPLLKNSQKQSNIINIASTAGITGIGSNIAYCASKAGLITMTKSFARSFGPKIRVNSVSPGLVKTEVTKSWKSYWNITREKSPLRVEMTPEGIADVVISIVENMEYVNGENIVVDTGINLN
jgi:3-oxoacyl-[acyl-carrier protein] reductase